MWKQTINVPAYKTKLTIEIDKPEDEITGLELLQMLYQAASELADELKGSTQGTGNITVIIHAKERPNRRSFGRLGAFW
jgi:hypothetical protein